MPLWGFKDEATESASGDLNSAASYKKGQQPAAETTGPSKRGKRNVVATPVGWVRRTVGTGARSGRIHDEILVAAHPGDASPGYSDGFPSNGWLDRPDCTELYLTNTSNTEFTTTISNGNISVTGGSQPLTVNLVFNEPVVFYEAAAGGLANLMITATLTANTTDAAGAGGDVIFNSNTTAGAIHTANNIVPFTSNGALLVGATYKFEAQTLVQHSANATIGLTQISSGIGGLGSESANTLIVGAVSNTLPAFTVST